MGPELAAIALRTPGVDRYMEMADGSMHIDQITSQRRAALKALIIDINPLYA